MLEPVNLPTTHYLIDRVEVHTLQTLSPALHSAANGLVLNSGISDLVGIEDPLTDLDSFGKHSLFILGMKGSQVMSHFGFTFNNDSFGKFTESQALRLIQIRGAASRIHQQGIFSASIRTFLERFLNYDSGIFRLMELGDHNPKGLLNETAYNAMTNPIILMSSTIHPFARGLAKTLLDLGFTHDTDAVTKATGSSHQVILEPQEDTFSLRIITGVGGYETVNGTSIPVRRESTQTYQVGYDDAEAVLMAQMPAYDANGRAIIDRDEKVILLMGHNLTTHAGIVAALRERVIAGMTSLTNADELDMRIVLEKA